MTILKGASGSGSDGSETVEIFARTTTIFYNENAYVVHYEGDCEVVYACMYTIHHDNKDSEDDSNNKPVVYRIESQSDLHDTHERTRNNCSDYGGNRALDGTNGVMKSMDEFGTAYIAAQRQLKDTVSTVGASLLRAAGGVVIALAQEFVDEITKKLTAKMPLFNPRRD